MRTISSQRGTAGRPARAVSPEHSPSILVSHHWMVGWASVRECHPNGTRRRLTYGRSFGSWPSGKLSVQNGPVAWNQPSVGALGGQGRVEGSAGSAVVIPADQHSSIVLPRKM